MSEQALEQEKGQFAQFNGRSASPEQADQIQSVIRDYNARVTALKKAQEAIQRQGCEHQQDTARPPLQVRDEPCPGENHRSLVAQVEACAFCLNTADRHPAGLTIRQLCK